MCNVICLEQKSSKHFKRKILKYDTGERHKPTCLCSQVCALSRGKATTIIIICITLDCLKLRFLALHLFNLCVYGAPTVQGLLNRNTPLREMAKGVMWGDQEDPLNYQEPGRQPGVRSRQGPQALLGTAAQEGTTSQRVL